MPTAIEQAIIDARSLIADAEDLDIPDSVYRTVLSLALVDISRWSPLRKKLALNIDTGGSEAALPADFLGFDGKSFAQAIAVPATSFRSWIFVFESSTSAASDLHIPFGSSIFRPDTVLDFLDDGAGGILMTINPAVGSPITLNVIYLARHQMADAIVSPSTPEVNTVPITSRDLLLFKMNELACRAMARNLAGDKNLHTNYTKSAESFAKDFDMRTVKRAFGRTG